MSGSWCWRGTLEADSRTHTRPCSVRALEPDPRPPATAKAEAVRPGMSLRRAPTLASFNPNLLLLFWRFGVLAVNPEPLPCLTSMWLCSDASYQPRFVSQGHGALRGALRDRDRPLPAHETARYFSGRFA